MTEPDWTRSVRRAARRLRAETAKPLLTDKLAANRTGTFGDPILSCQIIMFVPPEDSG